jgi:hypothetical protein
MKNMPVWVTVLIVAVVLASVGVGALAAHQPTKVATAAPVTTPVTQATVPVTVAPESQFATYVTSNPAMFPVTYSNTPAVLDGLAQSICGAFERGDSLSDVFALMDEAATNVGYAEIGYLVGAAVGDDCPQYSSLVEGQ